MKNLLLLLIIFCFIPFQACKKDEPEPAVKEPTPINLPAKATDVITRSNNFGMELFREVSNDEEENLMISPLSASVALTMLLNGCNSDTYSQIRDMLGYEGLTTGEINQVYKSLVEQLLQADEEVTLAIANAVWYRLGFNVHQSYLDAMDQAFASHIEGLDFASPAALDVMNQWASDNTNGKIPKVLDEISAEAVMFLMNALYFKGDWTYQFDPANTFDAVFSPDNSGTVNVPYMKAHIPAKMRGEDGYIAAELTYGRTNFSMVILVPENSVDELVNELDGEEWSRLTSALDAMPDPHEIDVLLPKFKFEYEKKLNDQLQALGMIDAFIPHKADLSGISNSGIYVSFVKQNTFVEVNEEGTEAAAVTTIGIELSGLPETFEVNKSFVFAIRERTTNTLLFIGKVLDPTV